MRYFFVLFFISFTLRAQVSSSVQLNQVTVTANIIETLAKNTGRDLIIIDHKTIESSPVKSIDGVLQYALNVDVRSRSSFGVQADVSIRGGNFDQTLFLLDGVKMNDPQTGHHSLNIPISLEQIERIEVLQGGASRVFGPNAFSGVINIITKISYRNSLSLGHVFGQNGLKMFSGSGSFHKKANYIIGNFESSKSNGYAYNTAYKKTISGLTFGRNLKHGEVSLKLSMLNNKFGASNFYSPKFYDQSEVIKAHLATLTWRNNFSNKLSANLNVSLRRHFDQYDFNNYEIHGTPNLINFHRTDVIDADYKFKSLNNFGKSAFGLEFRSENVISNRLGDALTNPVAVDGFPTVFYTKSKQRNNSSLFFEHQFSKKGMFITVGNLVNYNSQYGVAAYPGFDLLVPIQKHFSFYSSVNRSLRYPTFTELYLVSTTVISDPNLKPEKAWTYDMGLKFNRKVVFSGLTVFYKQTTDAIDKIKHPADAVPLMVNLNHINMFGLELNNKIDLSEFFKNKWHPIFQINYAYLKADRKENGFQSFYTLNYLRHKFSTGLNVDVIKNLNASIWYTYKFREGAYQWDASTPAVPYKPVKLVDIRINYLYKKYKVFLDLNNLLNYQYFEYGFVVQPGRWISAGINFHY